MKRWALRITILLVLGAVTTVGVAWGCSLLLWRIDEEGARIDLAHDKRHIDWWIDNRPDFWPARPETITEGEFFGASRILYEADLDSEHDDGTIFRWIVRETAGWPVRSVDALDRYMMLSSSSSATPVSEGFYFVDLSWIGGESRHVPSRVMLPGFLINTLFYAAIWFGLFFAMGRTRRFIRTRRGRCPRCGYDLRGEFDDGCSECGWGRAEDAA